MAEPYHVEIQRDVPAGAVSGLASFVETHYLTPNIRFMQGGGFSAGGGPTGRHFQWTIDPMKWSEMILPIGFPSLTVTLTITPAVVSADFSGFDPQDARVPPVCDRIADDIEVLVTSFLNHAKTTSLNFVFSVGHKAAEAPIQASGNVRREVMKRVFAGNTANLFLILMAMSFIFIIFLGDNAIIAILAVQGLALIFADRLMMGAGAVRVTQEHPEVAVVRVNCSPEVLQSLSLQGKKVVGVIKEAIDRAISAGNFSSPETKLAIHEVLTKAMVNVSVEDIQVTTRNPYALVKDVSEKFHLPIPKITMVNSPTDNAAATGISPGHASITITAGALEDLNDEQLESVIGHEFGHIKGRDPIILFAVTSVLYLGGLYLWLPVLLALGLFYFVIAFSIVYLVGKFLETRADTESAVVLGGPSFLASALTRIGFTQLYYERYSPRMRFLDWLRFDPHPPIYFRIQRLSRMARSGGKITHTLLTSIRDCISGFFGALVGVS
ncbi:MAG: M48 family metalloprotease [Thaumarchaeota archaeon]|nr:M48 family metalloprotease [Nitrososphaerota archaeon]